METKQRIRLLGKILNQLREGWIFVEGKRDREALALLGCRNVLTISGNLRISCDRLAKEGVGKLSSTDGNSPAKPAKVFILTDLDRRGEQLAALARDELEARSMMAELDTRKTLGRILNLRCFEDAKRKYDELIEEGEKYG